MASTDTCASLHEHFRKIYDLKHLGAIAGWDEAAMMPAGGGEARARALSTLNVMIQELVADPAVRDWIEDARSASLDEWQAANLREIERMVLEATAVPADVVRERTLVTAKSEQAWRFHRAENDWQSMQPLLEDVIAITRTYGQALADAKRCGAYDALLDSYEPGVTSRTVDAVFADLAEFLPAFVDEVIDKQSTEDVLPLTGDFSIDKQKQVGMQVMTALGFDFEHGRLDVSHHPFCGGVPDDVRITTRYGDDNFIESLMAVIHETGHAMYEQGLPRGWRDQPVGEARSAGTHESQSLLMEMQACRTREFLQFLAPILQRTFLGGETNEAAWSADNLYGHYTRVTRSYIRVDADEATYPLHVILRYELEKALIEGELAVADLPDAWDAKMQEYLGISTAGNFRDGCLQDVHWPAGLIGYFPTYTLGAMTAAQLFAAVVKEVDDVHAAIGRGDFAPLLGWLRENVHSKGSLLTFDELLTGATGSTLDAKWFKGHLRKRYLERD